MAKKLALKKQAKKVLKKSSSKKVVKKLSTKKVATKASAGSATKAVVKKVTQKESPKPKFVNHSTKLKVGNKAPYFGGKDQNGNLITSTSLLGKTIVLYFYPKDDTPGCTATACSLRDDYQFLSKQNYAIIGVSADDEKSHAKFAKKYELPFPLLADGNLKIMRAYDVWGLKQFMGKIYNGIIRTTFIIDEKGIIKNIIKAVDTANHAQQILSENH